MRRSEAGAPDGRVHSNGNVEVRRRRGQKKMGWGKMTDSGRKCVIMGLTESERETAKGRRRGNSPYLTEKQQQRKDTLEIIDEAVR